MADESTAAPEVSESTGSEELSKPIPMRQLLRNRSIRALIFSRAASKMGQSTMNYGSMVHLAQQNASQFQISIVSSMGYLAPLLFGVQGGTLADATSKRLALAVGMAIQAGLCFLIPNFIGTGVGSLMFLMFMTSLLMQVITPGLKSAVALVSTPSELASVSAILSLTGSIFSAIGSAVLAPILINVSGIDLVLYAAGIIFVIGSLLALGIPREDYAPSMELIRAINWKPQGLSLRSTATWLTDNPALGTMILSGAIVVALFESFNTLIPLYVKDVLGADPADSVYIFAPAGIGFVFAVIAAPRAIYKYGERKLLVISLVVMAVSMMGFGIINALAPFLAPISPLRLLGWLFDIEISNKVLAASVLAIPMNFGSGGAGAAVANFINRFVAVARQGSVFGLEEVQENALTMAAVLLLGGVANIVGAQRVMLLAPPIVILLILALVRYSFKNVGSAVLTRKEAWQFLTTGEPHLPDSP